MHAPVAPSGPWYLNLGKKIFVLSAGQPGLHRLRASGYFQFFLEYNLDASESESPKMAASPIFTVNTCPNNYARTQCFE